MKRPKGDRGEYDVVAGLTRLVDVGGKRLRDGRDVLLFGRLVRQRLKQFGNGNTGLLRIEPYRLLTLDNTIGFAKDNLEKLKSKENA